MKSCKGFINFWFGCQIYAGTASYFKRPFCFDRYIIYMLKTYKYNIYPTKEQQYTLAKIFGHVRYVYNIALDTKKAAFSTATGG